MEIAEYIQQKKDLQNSFLNYIEEEEENNENYRLLCKILETQTNREDLEQFLLLLNAITQNHHRYPNFIKRIEQIFQYLDCIIKQTFSNNEIFHFFKKNKLVLLLLIENKIITIDQTIANLIRQESDIKYFYPEIKSFLAKETTDFIEKKLLELDENILTQFNDKRKSGENELYICQLIRNDSVEEFIAYVNRTNFSLSSQIQCSLFETNEYLIQTKKSSLIEYATFYGSIQIFQYLKLNGVKLDHRLMKYAIHGKNSEMIHILEELIDDSYKYLYDDWVDEAIKCHHNEISDYLITNYIDEKKKEQIDELFFRYYNYRFFPDELNKPSIFSYLCEFNYITLLKLILKTNEFESLIMNKGLQLAAKSNNNLIVNLLLSSQKNIEINKNTFTECFYLTEIKFPFSVGKIEAFCFYCCFSLKTIIIPSSVKLIEKSAFEECKSLTNISIPPNVTEIGDYCFFNCRSLVEIDIQSPIIKIGKSTFRNCVSLKQMSVPESITEIESHLFCGCSNLESVSLSNNVTKIGCFAFNGCSSLKEIKIPCEVIIIEPYTFADCSSLKNVELPLKVTRIGDYSFKGCTSLIEIITPQTLKTIGESAFSGCSSLLDFTILPSIEEIEDRAFYNCTSLKSINILQNVNKIGHCVFDKHDSRILSNKYVNNESFRRIDVNRFEVSDRLSSNRYNSVFKIVDNETGKLYVKKNEFSIQVIHDDDNEIYNNFIDQQIRYRINANHPTFIQSYGYYLQNENCKDLITIMKYADNKSLDDLFNLIYKGLCPIEYDDTCRQIILIGAARAMKYLNDCGMNLCDIKPSNVLLDEYFHPYVNCSCFKYKEFNAFNKEYVSPEFFNECENLEKSNVFSFAILMYQIVTDDKPYYRIVNLQFLYEIVKGLRPSFNHPINHCLKELIYQCWSANPSERPTFKEIFKKIAYDENYYLENADVDIIIDYVNEITEN